jgi:hypothetical protein
MGDASIPEFKQIAALVKAVSCVLWLMQTKDDTKNALRTFVLSL